MKMKDFVKWKIVEWLSGKEMTIISRCYLRSKVKCPIFPLMLNILVITTN